MAVFAAAIGTNVTSPNDLIITLYIGILILLISLLALGIGLIRKEKLVNQENIHDETYQK